MKFRSDFDVDLIDHMGDDASVCRAARVSTLGAESLNLGESAGLIDFLMKNRHGSPFEHITMTWRISAPIFVWREFMRHRIASYNEESGRYKQLDPVFYMPHSTRPLRQIGKAGAYEFVPGDNVQLDLVNQSIRDAALVSYGNYEGMLEAGIAREVARMVLPVNIYSTAYVTMNARGLMNFLSLRTKHPESTFPSFPQYEINVVADMIEATFKDIAPLVYASFNSNGRVQP